jgi:hypothetical protein
MNIVNRVIGRKIRKLRKEKGLKTRDSSIGYKDLRQEWCKKIASKLSKRMNYESVGRQTFDVEELVCEQD